MNDLVKIRPDAFARRSTIARNKLIADLNRELDLCGKNRDFYRRHGNTAKAAEWDQRGWRTKAHLRDVERYAYMPPDHPDHPAMRHLRSG